MNWKEQRKRIKEDFKTILQVLLVIGAIYGACLAGEYFLDLEKKIALALIIIISTLIFLSRVFEFVIRKTAKFFNLEKRIQDIEKEVENLKSELNALKKKK